MASQFTNLSFFSVVCSPLRLNLLNPQCLTPKRWADEKRKQFLSTRSLENELVRHSWTLGLSEAVVKKKIKSDHSFVACSSHVELRLVANRRDHFARACDKGKFCPSLGWVKYFSQIVAGVSSTFFLKWLPMISLGETRTRDRARTLNRRRWDGLKAAVDQR